MSVVAGQGKEKPAMPQVLTLPALQQHINDVCTYFDWHKNENERTFMLFVEEVGELAKAIRKSMKIADEVGTEKSDAAVKQNLAEEFADCFNYLLDLANRFEIDLEAAYKHKCEQNFTRTWNRTESRSASK